MAKLAAERMSKMTGLECKIINSHSGEVSHPSWLKCFVNQNFPNEESFLVFDADIICMREWDPKGLFESLGRPFCAALDVNSKHVYRECQELQIGFPDVYVNGGLTIFGKEHAGVWSRVWGKHPKYGKWLEQGALNVALLEENGEVCRLPRRFNLISQFASIPKEWAEANGIINYHACGVGNAKDLLNVQTEFGL